MNAGVAEVVYAIVSRQTEHQRPCEVPYVLRNKFWRETPDNGRKARRKIRMTEKENDPMARKIDVHRALKDNDYLMSLTPAELSSIPSNPAGDLELTESDLDKVVGGQRAEGYSGCGTSASSCLACKRSMVAPTAC
jgi:mersacidin/lichenicidin family type 2 lantibiotic